LSVSDVRISGSLAVATNLFLTGFTGKLHFSFFTFAEIFAQLGG
jgi:hypothetical protein